MSKRSVHLRQGEKEIWVTPLFVRCRGFGLFASESGNDLTEEEFRSTPAQEKVRELFGSKVLKQLGRAVDERRAESWHNGAYAVEVLPAEISFGTTDRKGGVGTSVPVGDFLGGRFQDFVVMYFGHPTLQALVELCRALATGDQQALDAFEEPGQPNLLAELERAVALFGEAQNAKDFRARPQAAQMAEEATAIVRQCFRDSPILCEIFPALAALLERGDREVEFSFSDLERARAVLGE